MAINLGRKCILGNDGDKYKTTGNTNPVGWYQFYFDLSYDDNYFYISNGYFKFFYGSINGWDSSKYIDKNYYRWYYVINIKNSSGVSLNIANLSMNNVPYHYNNNDFSYWYISNTSISRSTILKDSYECLYFDITVYAYNGYSKPGAANIDGVYSINTGIEGRYSKVTSFDVLRPSYNKEEVVKHNGSFYINTTKFNGTSYDKTKIVATMTNSFNKSDVRSITYDEGYGVRVATNRLTYGSEFYLKPGTFYDLSVQRIHLNNSSWSSPIVNRSVSTYPLMSIELNSTSSSNTNADNSVNISWYDWKGEPTYTTVSVGAYTMCNYYSNGNYNGNRKIMNYSFIPLNTNSVVKKYLESKDEYHSTNNVVNISIKRIGTITGFTNTVYRNFYIHFRPIGLPTINNNTIYDSTHSYYNCNFTTNSNITIPIKYNGYGIVSGYDVNMVRTDNSNIYYQKFINVTNKRSSDFSTNAFIPIANLISTKTYKIKITPYYESNNMVSRGNTYTHSKYITCLLPSNANCKTKTNINIYNTWVGKNFIISFKLPNDANYEPLDSSKKNNYKYQDIILKVTAVNSNSTSTEYVYKYSTNSNMFLDSTTDCLKHEKTIAVNLAKANLPNTVSYISKIDISAIYSTYTDGTTNNFLMYNFYNNNVNLCNSRINTLNRLSNIMSGDKISYADLKILYYTIYNMLCFLNDTKLEWIQKSGLYNNFLDMYYKINSSNIIDVDDKNTTTIFYSLFNELYSSLYSGYVNYKNNSNFYTQNYTYLNDYNNKNKTRQIYEGVQINAINISLVAKVLLAIFNNSSSI